MNGKKRINLTFLLFCFKLETVNNANFNDIHSELK